MKMKNIFLSLAILFCAGTAQASEITISAASSLTNAFTQLKAVFEKQNPNTTLYLNFASSNTLLKQIQEGAPVDVYASADQITMNKAVKDKIVLTATRQNFALNGLVLIVPANSKNIPTSANDLLDKKYIHIAIGNIASVPVGRYTKAALVSDDLWEKLYNRFIFAEHVRQVLDYVARGEVDAGFVYTTDAYIAKDKVKIALTMDGHDVVSYPIAVVSDSKNKILAQKFIDFVLSDSGQKVLATYGFVKP